MTEEGWSEAVSGSPRQIIKTAFQARLITDEKGWLSAMQAGNTDAHTYNEEIAMTLIADTKEIFIPLFDQLAEKLGEENRR